MATGFVDATRVELHRGAIPVEVRLAQDEVADVSPPPPLFALIPRGAYLPCWHDGPHAIDDDDATTTRDRASAADSTRTFMTSVDGRDDARERDGRTEVRKVEDADAAKSWPNKLLETAVPIASIHRAERRPRAR